MREAEGVWKEASGRLGEVVDVAVGAALEAFEELGLDRRLKLRSFQRFHLLAGFQFLLLPPASTAAQRMWSAP